MATEVQYQRPHRKDRYLSASFPRIYGLAYDNSILVLFGKNFMDISLDLTDRDGTKLEGISIVIAEVSSTLIRFCVEIDGFCTVPRRPALRISSRDNSQQYLIDPPALREALSVLLGKDDER